MGVEKGSPVSEVHLYRMLGEVTDPLTGAPLGRARTLNCCPSRSGSKSAWSVFQTICVPNPRTRETEDRGRGEGLGGALARPPVAGFDLTFSPSKSLSVAWALADQGTKAIIFECHRRAIDYVLTYAEKHVFHSRSGTNGIMQEDIEGVVAAAFTHYDTCAIPSYTTT